MAANINVEILKMITNSFQLLDEVQLEFLRETVKKIGVPKVLSGKWQWRESSR